MSLKDFSSTSAASTDKIVFTATGTVNIASLPEEYNNGFGYIVRKVELPHGMPRPVFPEFRYSNDGGTNWNVGGSGSDSIAYCTNTNIVILIQSGMTGTFSYEVFGLWIDDFDNTNPLIDTPTISANSYFDSRKNYRKILLQGAATVNSSVTIAHNLGYYPAWSVYFESRPGQVWQEHGGGIRNTWYFDPSMEECFSYADTNNLIIELAASGTAKVWHRVYADG